MQYERLVDDASIIIGENGESQLISSSLNNNKNVCLIRKTALILLFIQLILCIILFLVDICLLIADKDENYYRGIRSFGLIFLSMAYYGYGFIVVYQLHHLGIYVFDWLGFVQYLVLCADVFLNSIFILKRTPKGKEMNIDLRVALTITIISIFQIILMVITLKYTFKLVRLMRLHKRDVLEQL